MATAGTKVIRVFLSSTFVDFQEERSLLVKQVFPSLRRRANSRGVDIVDVDLRWGVTAEQTERGETLPLCLAEIDNCRPYFISLLGERYGWVPPADFYKPALLERQPWLKERMGGASVTELEILHGVLRNPEMAGHALFYLRDPAYAQAQQEAGWVADNPAEQQRLQALKEQIRASGFPVVEEGLATPQAIAERIEEDLWAVIEREHPEQEPPDALQREGQRHSDYRRSRTGLYLGGEAAIEQLERWIAEGEQRILITGESGAGKSALIANWLEAHLRSYPQDLVHAHHLGCTNDASAVRPLLGRLIDTASQLLAEEPTTEPLKVPQDWWELVFMVGEVFALLSSCCQKQGCRWILVLDGLDRLAEDDQQALPWIPTSIPPGIHVVASSLDCPARSILQERQYRTHEIGPLGKAEQQQLIERYLSRYTKQLESGLQQKILAHKLAGSPMFLKVLLEELRQCAWYDTLEEQLESYLAAETIDGLYAKVLERLERDGHGEATRKALTALWASRAGLSETELLDIKGLLPMEWAPVDLALSEAFGRNAERIVFDHEYLRIAVHDRYLPSDINRTAAHLELANFFFNQIRHHERTYEELPWQWLHARDWRNLWHLFCTPRMLIAVCNFCGLTDVVQLWKRAEKHLLAIHSEIIGEPLERVTLADLLESSIQDDVTDFEEQPNSDELLIAYFTRVADLCEAIDVVGYIPMRARVLAFEISRDSNINDERRTLHLLGKGIDTLIANCDYIQARELCEYQISRVRQINGSGSMELLECLENMFAICLHTEDDDMAQTVCAEMMNHLPSEHVDWSPRELDLKYHQCVLMFRDRRFSEVICVMEKMLETSLFLGEDLSRQNSIIKILAQSYGEIGDLDRAEDNARKSLAITRSQFGTHHPETIHSKSILAAVYAARGDHHIAKSLYYRCLEQSTIHFGEGHIQTNSICSKSANLLCDLSEFESAIPLVELAFSSEQNYLSKNLPDTLALAHRLAEGLCDNENLPEAKRFFRLALNGKAEVLGNEDASTMESLYGLACCLSALEEYSEAIGLRRLELVWYEQEFGPQDSRTLCSMHELALDLQRSCELQEAEVLFRRSLTGNEQTNGVEHPDTHRVAFSLAELLSATSRLDEAIPLRRRELAWCQQQNGRNDLGTLHSLHQLAIDLRKVGDLEEAEEFLREILATRLQILDPADDDIARSLDDLSETLEAAGKLEEACQYAEQALQHRIQHESADAWMTNMTRLELAQFLLSLSRDDEAQPLLQEIRASLGSLEEPDEEDLKLIAQASELLEQINA